MFTMPWSATKDYMHPLAPMQKYIDNKTSYALVGIIIIIIVINVINVVIYREDGVDRIGKCAE